MKMKRREKKRNEMLTSVVLINMNLYKEYKLSFYEMNLRPFKSQCGTFYSIVYFSPVQRVMLKDL